MASAKLSFLCASVSLWLNSEKNGLPGAMVGLIPPPQRHGDTEKGDFIEAGSKFCMASAELGCLCASVVKL